MQAIERISVVEKQMENLEQKMEQQMVQLETLLNRFTEEIDTLHERISSVQARLQAMHSLNMRGLSTVDDKKE